MITWQQFCLKHNIFSAATPKVFTTLERILINDPLTRTMHLRFFSPPTNDSTLQPHPILFDDYRSKCKQLKLSMKLLAGTTKHSHVDVVGKGLDYSFVNH